jgi:hypothetical protein
MLPPFWKLQKIALVEWEAMWMPRYKMFISFPASEYLNLPNDEVGESNNPSALSEPVQRPSTALSLPDERPEKFDVALNHRLGLHSGWKGVCMFLRQPCFISCSSQEAPFPTIPIYNDLSYYKNPI